MLTMVEARTIQGDLLSLPLSDQASSFTVDDIDGLDPVKATLVSSSFARLDGQQYQSSRREARNIKLRLGLDPDYVTESVRDLRARLYTYFMPKSQVSLRFYMSEGLTVEIVGRVESFETTLFTKEPSVDISIMCFDPDFYELTSELMNENTTSTTAETLHVYEGNVETGIIFTLNVDRTLTEFTIYHRPPDDSMRTLDFAGDLLAGDTLVINTIPGSKGATRTRASTSSSVLYGVSPQASWIELMPGDNYIRVYAIGAAIPFTIAYTNKYGGL